MTEINRVLDPERIRGELLRSALYLTAYELLKNSIIDPISDFLCPKWISRDSAQRDRYKQEVLGLDKDVLTASCLWLAKMGAIEESDVRLVSTLRRQRNNVAHELPRLLLDADLGLSIGKFEQIEALLRKIDVWWIVNVHVPTNPDFENVEIDESEVTSGRMMLLSYIVSIVLRETSSGDAYQTP